MSKLFEKFTSILYIIIAFSIIECILLSMKLNNYALSNMYYNVYPDKSGLNDTSSDYYIEFEEIISDNEKGPKIYMSNDHIRYKDIPFLKREYELRVVDKDLKEVKRDRVSNPVDSFPESFYTHKDFETMMPRLTTKFEEFVKLTETKEMNCKKLLKMGGRSCKYKTDGEKYICMDSSIRYPVRNKCLIYSFGIGHDFSFEVAMSKIGCHVFAFDDDGSHDTYPAIMADRVYFSRIRIADIHKYETVFEKHPNGSMLPRLYVYRPIDAINFILEQENITLDYLKMDIEGMEWNVFNNSIFKTNILNRTRFLGLEIHLQNLLNETIITTPHHLENILDLYNYFFRTLRSFGFRLFHHESNFITPVHTSIFSKLVPVFQEMVWYNPNAPKDLQEINPHRPMDWYVDQVEKVVL